MRLSQKFVFILWAGCFFACKKEKEPAIPAPGPCEGLAVGVVPLKTNWTTSDIYANTDDHPIVYGDQVIFNKWGGTYFHQLIGFNKQTGVQEWFVKVQGSFLPEYAKVQGNQIYWVDRYSRQFVSFDLDNHTFKVLWAGDSTVVFVSLEFQLIKRGALLETIHEYNSNVKKAAVLEKIDFQDNTSTELYRADQFFNDFTMEGFWGIQLTSNAAGDTLAVFVNTIHITNFGNLSSLLAINIKQKKIEQEIDLPSVFYKDDGVLIVKDGQAWLSQTLGEFSSSIANFSLQNGVKNWEITTNYIDAIKFAGGKIITFNDLGTYAFEPTTGEIIWQNEGTLRNPMDANSSWFELNGQYFMIRGHKFVQIDLETGCTLKNQSIEFASEFNPTISFQKDPVLNLMYIELKSQMLAVQL